MSKKISILGTGWLGFPLAQALINRKYIVKGSTTTENKIKTLESKDINAYQIALNEEGPVGNIIPFLEGSKILIINIPPGLRRNPDVNFVAKIQNLVPYIEKSSIKKVLFVSSTSVFADLEGFPLIFDKTIPNATSSSGKQLVEAEQLLQKNKKFETTILRFAGLFGPNRHPATMLSRRTNIKNPKAPVNLIHLDDCIGVIQKIIEMEKWNEVFHASYPDHPKKAEYYGMACKQMGLPKPDYDYEAVSKGKVIESQKILQDLLYDYKNNIFLA